MIFIVLLPLIAIIALLYTKLILWKMHQDLEEWISYGTGDDIFRCRDQRKEYQYYAEQRKYDTPAKVLIAIREDLRSSKVSPIYLHILWLLIKGKKFN